MLEAPGAQAAALRKAVTSPKGTTEQAIATFDARGVREAIAEGEQNAVKRSLEMARDYA
jgi:pyrroline-5-carboxylate reductase